MALDYQLIGSRLRQARLSKELTLEELADQLSVSVPFLSRVETGSAQINLKRLSEICALLDVPESSILVGSSDTSDEYLEKDFGLLLKSLSPKTQKLIYKVAKIIAESEE